MKTRRCYLIFRSMTRIIVVLIPCFLHGAFAQDCVDVSGTWHVEESATVTFNAEGETETIETSGSGEITIEQNGCGISFYSQGLSPDGSNIMLLREGTVTHDRITFSGRMVPDIPEVSCSVDSITGEGVIEGNTMIVTSTGEASCSMDGISVLVTINGSAVFTRSVTVELESIEVKNGILIRDIPQMIWSKDEPSQLYPFAASMEQGTVKLHIKLSDVNNNYTYTPTVRCAYSWKPINRNPLTYQYPDEFEGWEGDINVNIPQGANLYDLALTIMAFDEGVRIYEEIIIDPEDPDKGITAYITLDRPLRNLSNPKEEWLEKATLWAQGSSTRETILSSLNMGIYHQLYLEQNERWTYDLTLQPSWQELLMKGIPHSGDCVSFSNVWCKLAQLHGIRGTDTTQLVWPLGFIIPLPIVKTETWGF